jgi:GNAT superfamily N-acetyltransferase
VALPQDGVVPDPPVVSVRQARDDDDLDALNAGSSSWMGAAFHRRLFDVPDGLPKRMLVAELDGVPGGYAHTVGHGIANGHRGMAYVFVSPAHRRRGLGGALWRAVLEICTPDRVPGVLLSVDDGDVDSLAVAASHGLRPLGLHHESELDLSTVEPLRTLASAPPGVTLRPLPPDAPDSVWRRFLEVMNTLARDAPDFASGAEPMPYEIFRAVFPEPWQVMGAWEGDDLVGLTGVAVRDQRDRRLNTTFTGVARGYRGRGLATALKSAQALALRDAGWRTIVTQNMEGNEPILASNRRLGFRRSAGHRDLVYDHAG